MRAVAFLVVALVASACATTHLSNARFVSRSPAGGVVATPSAEIGMDDANAMIAAHCGAGGYAITREGENLVGDTVVTEGANSLDAQTTDGSGQLQGHDSQKTVYARGSDWQVNYTCNDPHTVNMGLITRTRTQPSRLAWGGDVAAGMMLLSGHAGDAETRYSSARAGSAMAIGAYAWLGYKLSDKFALGGGLGSTQLLAAPEWEYGAQNEIEQDAGSFEFFATAKYAVASDLDMQVRVGLANWHNLYVDGGAPLAAAQLAYKMLDVGPAYGVYLGGGVSTYLSSSMTSNVIPAVTLGFH